MLERLMSEDWECAFSWARGVEQGYACGSGAPEAVPVDAPDSVAPFSREDVKRIIGIADGENDWEDWLGVFELHDGRFACLRAGCDYTGWD